jgi:hypothetical protein
MEKRQHPRVEIAWPVTVITDNALWEARAENISLVGTLIRCSIVPSLLYYFRLIFKLSDSQILLATAERVWSRTPTNGNSMCHEMGVRFVYVPEHDFQLIDEAIMDRI